MTVRVIVGVIVAVMMSVVVSVIVVVMVFVVVSVIVVVMVFVVVSVIVVVMVSVPVIMAVRERVQLVMQCVVHDFQRHGIKDPKRSERKPGFDRGRLDCRRRYSVANQR